MKQNSLLSALALSALIALPLPGAAQASTRQIVVTQIADLSGPGADFGRDYSLGAKIYFDHVNAAGGIRGKRIVFHTADSGGQSNRAAAAAREALSSNGETVFFGVTGDASVDAVAREARPRGAALFGAVTASSPLGIDDGVFTLRSGLADEIAALVSQLRQMGVSSFGLVATGNELNDAARLLSAEAERQGARLVAQSALPLNVDGATKAVDQIAAKRPQAVIVIGDTLSAAQFFKRYRSVDPGAFLCAPSLVNVKTLLSAIGSQAARGLIVGQVVPAPDGTGDISREHRKLMEKYADEPPSHATMEGFIAAKVLVNSLQKSGEASLPALRQNLPEGKLNLGGYELNFGKGGRPSRFVELSVINRDGRLLR